MPCGNHDPKNKIYLHLAEGDEKPTRVEKGVCGDVAVLPNGKRASVYEDYLGKYYLKG